MGSPGPPGLQCCELELTRDDVLEVSRGVLAELLQSEAADRVPAGLRALHRAATHDDPVSEWRHHGDRGTGAITGMASHLFDHVNFLGGPRSAAERRLGFEIDALFLAGPDPETMFRPSTG